MKYYPPPKFDDPAMQEVANSIVDVINYRLAQKRQVNEYLNTFDVHLIEATDLETNKVFPLELSEVRETELHV